MKNYRAESNVLPDAVDMTNANIVLVNENVVYVPATEEKPMMYEYDVKEYSKEEYGGVRITSLENDTNAIVDVLAASLGVVI